MAGFVNRCVDLMQQRCALRMIPSGKPPRDARPSFAREFIWSSLHQASITNSSTASPRPHIQRHHAQSLRIHICSRRHGFIWWCRPRTKGHQAQSVSHCIFRCIAPKPTSPPGPPCLAPPPLIPGRSPERGSFPLDHDGTARSFTTLPQLPPASHLSPVSQQLTLHSRRVQGHHAILPQVHQITPWNQRLRMSQPVKVIPVLSDGSVRTGPVFLSTERIPSHGDPFSCHKPHSLLKAREGRGACHTDLSKLSNRVVGNLGQFAAVRQGRDAALIPDLLSDLKRLGCQARPLSAPTLPQRPTRCFAEQLPPQPYPHLHIVPSHCVGSIRTELIVAQDGHRTDLTDSDRAHRNLMAPDSFRNLGFGEDADGHATSAATATPARPAQPQGHDKPRTS